MTDHEALTRQTVDLLRDLIRNACVNDGSPDSGGEIRSVRTIEGFLAGSGLEIEVVEPHPGRASLVARIPGTDRSAPSLALVGHTDVVPVNEAGWAATPSGRRSSTERCGAAARSTCSSSQRATPS